MFHTMIHDVIHEGARKGSQHLHVLAIIALLGAFASCDPGPDDDLTEQQELKKWTGPGSGDDAMAYMCNLSGYSCGFAIPSLATFCGDVGPDTATRISASALKVAFDVCPHPDDAGCSGGVYRNPAWDGAIAEVEIRYSSTTRATFRIKPNQLTTSGCPNGQRCAVLNTGGTSYNYVVAKPLSGWQRGTVDPSTQPGKVLFGASATAFGSGNK